LYDTLAELCKEKKMLFSPPVPYIEYIPPKLTQGKIWYISYSCRQPSTGKMKRIRIKLNRIVSINERKRIARELIASLDLKLKMGWNPFVEATAPNGYEAMSSALDRFIKVKEKENEENSMRSYRSFIKTFRKWLDEKGYSTESYYACSFSEADAISFMDRIESSVSPRTYNNYLLFYRTLFNWMKERKYISRNPFDNIRKKSKRLTAKMRRMFTQEELDRLIAFLEKENIQYLVIVLLCYCCFIRPKEIALLKCGDINIGRQLVHIRSEIAKNDNDSYRTIPDSMVRYLSELDLSVPENYLFSHNAGYDFRPGAKPVSSRKLAKFWNDVVRPACGFPMELQFYSLKDTGITNMVSSGIALTSVQQQADHSSIAMTSIYVGKNRRKAAEDLKNVDIID